ncbi:MAG: DEAD/DEAH box helicase family protein, partial [Bacteroidia bacterium]|nr:DEAD/DEAH box helicase family protein [Bacteroidia bacterium]
SEVRGGKAPRIKRLSEYLGQSYFEYLAGLPDLVLLMDESHRYRASAGARAITELKPILGLELTATPYVETGKGAIPFQNVIYDYPLSRAMADGFVKEPAVVTRQNFNPAGMAPEAVERLKLEDGIRLHERVKVELETYARQTGQKIVKPFVLVIARDTTHAKQLLDLLQSEAFFEGRYREKTIQVDSSKTGAEEEEMISRLLKVEDAAEPTEIVIHVNMLKEGWDVTNLYTIVPLRAANARVLIEQSIGRGLRLPYGKRTGVAVVDRLNIVAHDRFQEIVDEANRPDSVIRLQSLTLTDEDLSQKTTTVVSVSNLEKALNTPYLLPEAPVAGADEPAVPLFGSEEEKSVARVAYEVIQSFEKQPDIAPNVRALDRPEVQAAITRAVEEKLPPRQMTIEGLAPVMNVAEIVAKTTHLAIQQTLDIPRIIVIPSGRRSGFHPFSLDLSGMKYAPVADALWIQHLRTRETELLSLSKGGTEERRLEDYVVSGLIDFDDIAYDRHASLLYDLASQVVRHLTGYLSEEEARKVLRLHQKEIARFVYVQMQAHYWEEADSYEVKVTRGFTALKPSAFTSLAGEVMMPYDARYDGQQIVKHVFGGYKRCLYDTVKFQSTAERVLAIILDRDSLRWFRPAKGQFQIFYRSGSGQEEYQPDFVAETETEILMLEPKARRDLEDPVVLAKQEAARNWCMHASDYAREQGGKPWRYVLIPHDVIAENMGLAALA